MIDELNKAINEYQTKWHDLVAQRTDQALFAAQRPTAIGWKVADVAGLTQTFEALRDYCDQIHWGWVDERWLVTMHLKATKLAWDIELVKLLQCKPGAAPTAGLDHLDFSHPQNKNLEQLLQAEPNLEWTHKANNPHCTYYSLRFDSHEAKLRIGVVLDPCIAELKAVRTQLLPT